MCRWHFAAEKKIGIHFNVQRNSFQCTNEDIEDDRTTTVFIRPINFGCLLSTVIFHQLIVMKHIFLLCQLVSRSHYNPSSGWTLNQIRFPLNYVNNWEFFRFFYPEITLCFKNSIFADNFHLVLNWTSLHFLFSSTVLLSVKTFWSGCSNNLVVITNRRCEFFYWIHWFRFNIVCVISRAKWQCRTAATFP